MSALNELRGYVREMAEISAGAALAHWDQRTCMPEKGAEARARVVGRLARMSFERLVSPRMGELLAAAKGEVEDSEVDRALVRHWEREHQRYRAIPPDLYQRFVEACARAETTWEKAKAASDFPLFRLHLAEVVDLVREIAELIGYQESPYDALVEEYEPGMTARKLRAALGELREGLVSFLTKLREDGTPPPPLPHGPFRVEAQRALAQEVLQAMGYDFTAGRLDDSAHPFTIGIGPGDTRVTNRYREDEPFSALFGALHEGGPCPVRAGGGPVPGLDGPGYRGFVRDA